MSSKSNVNRNIRKTSLGYFVCISRVKNKKTYTRSSYSREDMYQAMELRDQWLKEYEEDKEKWIEDTINKTYKK